MTTLSEARTRVTSMLHVHHADRADELVERLVELLAVPAADVFAPEVVAVESLGVQRWLSQALAVRLGQGAGGDGVCANVVFPRPRALVDSVVAQACAIRPEDDPWAPGRLPWTILQVIDDAGQEPWIAPVVHYLESGSGRRVSTSQRVARLFTTAMRFRPEAVAGWLAGADDVPDDLAWQPELFRRCRDLLAVPSPVERVDPACAAIAADASAVDLPERVFVFNPGELTAAERRVLEALGVDREVHLCLLAELPSSLTPEVTSARVEVHSCHGRLRQVEILRETLLGVLDEDPSLEPRDIVVMVPDVAAFAPLISAVFLEEPPATTADQTHPGARLQVRLADRSMREVNTVVAALTRLFDLATARVTVAEVADLAALPAVRATFGFTEDELERISDWAERAGVRWGINAASRAPYALERFEHNTWRAGLDRLLTGVAMDEEGLHLLGGVLPMDDVDSGEIDLVGRLAELLERLDSVLGAFAHAHELVDWVAVIESAIESLILLEPSQSWQIAQVRERLARLVEDAGGRPSGPLHLRDMRQLLADLMQGSPVRAGFRSGRITVTSLAPLRAVPHPVVAVLGLDDGEFPRASRRDGDDLLVRDPRPTDPDRAEEERRLFAEAVRAAQRHLLLFYSGRDERTGVRRAPAVPLAELIETMAPRVVEHPLQSFDPRAFAPGVLGNRSFSFDPVGFAGARAVTAPRQGSTTFLDRPISTPDLDVVDIATLTSFVAHPVKAFLKQGLEISVPGDEEASAQEIPVELNGLERWKLGDRLLRAGRGGAPYDRVVAAEIARGELPPGALGRAAFQQVVAEVDLLLGETDELRQGPARRIDLDVALPSGRRLVGSVRDVYAQHLVRLVYSKLRPRDRLAAWIHVLAVSAQEPEHQWAVTVLGRGRDPRTVEGATYRGTLADRARFLLDDLVDLMASGLAEPLPLFELPSFTYALDRRRGRPATAAMQRARWDWERRGGPGDDPIHRLVWGDIDFGRFESGPGDDTEPHRFGALARRLWEPLLSEQRGGAQ